MKYLNETNLKKATTRDFKGKHPYPHGIFEEMLTPDGYKELVENMPDQKLFEQRNPLRLFLEYDDLVDPTVLPKPWQEFMQELHSKKYRRFIQRIYAHQHVNLRFHWYYARKGYGIYPHCDHTAKLGSHIFYLNTEKNWKPEWGGGTLVLEPKNGPIPAQAADDGSTPLDAFRVVGESGPIGNLSMMFERTETSWHGMKPLDCPEGFTRNVFIVIVDRMSLLSLAKHRVSRSRPVTLLKSKISGKARTNRTGTRQY